MPDPIRRTRWGGIADAGREPGGRFRTERIHGVHWLIDPDGGRLLSKGVNTVRIDQDRIRDSERTPYAEACLRKYGSMDAWRRAAAARLAGWGYNTLGSWSDETVATVAPATLAVTPNLDLGMSFAWETNDRAGSGPKQDFPDVFDPAFAAHIARRAKELCRPHADAANVIGWFIDNELRWGADWRGSGELLTSFLNLAPATPGRAAAIEWLRGRYANFDAFNAAWRTPARTWDELRALAGFSAPFPRKPLYQRDTAGEAAANRTDSARARFAADCDDFLGVLAERYFAATAAAIRAADPNHLVLGSRFAYPPPAAVIEAAGRHTDVISFNCYDNDPEAALRAYAAAGRPCLIGEFSFRGADSGLPNTNGAGPVVATQTERAESFRRYVTAALRNACIVGYHWFEHADQPAEGRFDGENSNFGTVTIDDRVYEELTRTMTAVNAEADDLHSAAAQA